MEGLPRLPVEGYTITVDLEYACIDQQSVNLCARATKGLGEAKVAFPCLSEQPPLMWWQKAEQLAAHEVLTVP